MHDTRLLDVVPVSDDDVAALRVEVPEVGAVEAPAAVPPAVLVKHHVVLARHQLLLQREDHASFPRRELVHLANGAIGAIHK